MDLQKHICQLNGLFMFVSFNQLWTLEVLHIPKNSSFKFTSRLLVCPVLLSPLSLASNSPLSKWQLAVAVYIRKLKMDCWHSIEKHCSDMRWIQVTFLYLFCFIHLQIKQLSFKLHMISVEAPWPERNTILLTFFQENVFLFNPLLSLN